MVRAFVKKGVKGGRVESRGANVFSLSLSRYAPSCLSGLSNRRDVHRANSSSKPETYASTPRPLAGLIPRLSTSTRTFSPALFSILYPLNQPSHTPIRAHETLHPPPPGLLKSDYRQHPPLDRFRLPPSNPRPRLDNSLPTSALVSTTRLRIPHPPNPKRPTWHLAFTIVQPPPGAHTIAQPSPPLAHQSPQNPPP